MVYIKDIPSMGYTCRAYLICTLRKNFAVIAYLPMYMLLIASQNTLGCSLIWNFQTTPERISFFSNENIHKKPSSS